MKNEQEYLHKLQVEVEDLKEAFKDTLANNKEPLQIFTGVLFGLAAGAILGILFAPNSGKQTRSTIANSVKGVGDNLMEIAKQGASSINDLKQKATQKVKSTLEQRDGEEAVYAYERMHQKASLDTL